ncbi:MAG: MerR family transcriptional regulator [Desulfocucumaceae bacterium]
MKSSRPIEPAFFDLAGASAYLGGALQVRTLRRLIAQPDGLPHYRIGRGKVLIKRADLDAYLAHHRQTPADLDTLAEKAIREFRQK